MRDEQWDVFWSQVYWLAAISLAALPLVPGIWTDAQGTGWLRALEEHYRELVAYTMLLMPLLLRTPCSPRRWHGGAVRWYPWPRQSSLSALSFS